MSLWVVLQGFSLGATMIIPIGAQNAYVLNQGMRRNHHLTTATVCSLLDMLFISLGIFGGGAFISQNDTLLLLVTLGGIAFLSFYGYLSLKSAWQLNTPSQPSEQGMLNRSRRAVILGALAVTVLNPHLYLDTVVILGSIGGQFAGNERFAFALGTILASFVWFYTLSLGAAKLSPILTRPKVKQTIDVVIAIMMFIIAALLVKGLYQMFY
ncbi:LysE/ArgO family amino acid transporter [Vibrio cincinnatiensis]|uniref:LysE/ArgO family amino acid transporter n=1 Tax=Vibrio cincinnatiensis TaxID=675 RepID=UPI001EE13645|nr:amino acid transporter [Vibrio cincinnatiensis]